MYCAPMVSKKVYQLGKEWYHYHERSVCDGAGGEINKTAVRAFFVTFVGDYHDE